MIEENALNISNAELDIMKVIWSSKNTTSRDVIDILSITNKWKPTTIKTLLSRLVEKNILKVEKSGNKNIYYPIITEDEALEAIFNDASNKVCSKGIGKMIEFLINSKELSSIDIKNIQNALLAKKPNDDIKCDCVEKFGRCTCSDHNN